MKMTAGAKVILRPAEAGEAPSTMVYSYVSQLILVVGRNSISSQVDTPMGCIDVLMSWGLAFSRANS